MLLAQCAVSDTLELIIAPAVKATARCESSDSPNFAKSLQRDAMMDEVLETPTWDRCSNGPGFRHQSASNAGPLCLSEMVPQRITNPSWLQRYDESSDLSLYLGVADAAHLYSLPLETPTLDRYVPAVHVSCRSPDHPAFIEKHAGQPAFRSWIATAPVLNCNVVQMCQ